MHLRLKRRSSFVFFSFLALVWALFMPPWLESLMNQTVRKVLFVIGVNNLPHYQSKSS